MSLRAPFPYFGGKRTVAHEVWARFGHVKQYIEPFCGSAAVLLAAPTPASLEVIGDANMYIANFWRAVKLQPEAVWAASDYPVSHLDMNARHRWLTQPARRAELAAALADPEWPGDAKIAGWWAWGQCCWIGSGWCEKSHWDQIPFVISPGKGLQSEVLSQELGKIPHASDSGRGLTPAGLGQIPFVTCPGQGLVSGTLSGAYANSAEPDISAHRAGAREWIRRLSERLERVRIVHGSWDRCLNHHYGDTSTAVFLDPPYLAFEKLYAADVSAPVAKDVEAWARENAELRIALCGHVGDYDLPGWECFEWERKGNTYGGDGTKDAERIWFSPSCISAKKPQLDMFGGLL